MATVSFVSVFLATVCHCVFSARPWLAFSVNLLFASEQYTSVSVVY